MNERDFKPNSHKYKTEQKTSAPTQKRVEKVINGPAKVKNSDMRRLADVFISEDVKNVKSYVLMDVLVPTIKNAIVDVVTNGVNMIFYGNAAARKSSRPGDYVDYSRPSANRGARVVDSSGYRPKYAYGDIVVNTRPEAEMVLRQMYDLIDTYGEATVLDLYDAIGVTRPFTDAKYGWTAANIRNAEIVRVNDGYMIKMPKAIPLG